VDGLLGRILEWKLRYRKYSNTNYNQDRSSFWVPFGHEYVRGNFVEDVISEHQHTRYGHAQIE
jgi:hypothetical protein